MKKLSFVLSLFLVFALLLGACASADEGQEGTGSETGITEVAPGVETTEPLEEPTEALATEPPTLEPTEAIVATEPATVEATAVATDTMATQDRNPYLVSDLLGYTVATADNDGVGEVEVVVADRETGQINYLLVDPDDDLEMDDGYVAVPWGGLQYREPTAGDVLGNFIFNLDQEVFVNAPVIALDEDIDFDNETWDDDVVAYWSNDIATLPATGVTGENAGMVRIEDATDMQLLNQNGEDIGDVEDMTLDPSKGVINYIVWASGGLLDLGEKLILVPFENLTWDRSQDNAFVLNGDPEMVKDAPTIDSLDDIDWTSPDWDAEFKQFWASLTQ